MTKKFKKNKRNPPYWNNKALTVGMLEDFLKKIPNKSSVVQMTDRSGTGPENVLKAFWVMGSKNNILGISLSADFSWTDNDEDYDDEDYDDEDEYVEATNTVRAAVISCLAKASSACGLDPEAEESQLPEGVLYLGDAPDGTKSESAKP